MVVVEDEDDNEIKVLHVSPQGNKAVVQLQPLRERLNNRNYTVVRRLCTSDLEIGTTSTPTLY